MSGGEREAMTRAYGLAGVETMRSMSGLDFLRAILAGTLPGPPISRTLGFHLADVAEGSAVFEGLPGEAHMNVHGTAHAGYAATLLDSCMACAVHSTLPRGTGYTTMEFKISLVRPIMTETGLVRAEGKVLSRGRRAATAEGTLTDAAGKLLAHATTTCLIFEL